MNLPDLPPPTSTPTEWSEVERPLLSQLHAMGWAVLCLENEQDKIDYPSATGRGHFREVVQYETLTESEALRGMALQVDQLPSTFVQDLPPSGS